MDTRAIRLINERLARCEVAIQQAQGVITKSQEQLAEGQRVLLANAGAHEVLTELLGQLEQSVPEEVAVDA